MKKSLFLLISALISSESSWGLQTLFKGGSELFLYQSSRFPKRAFCTSSGHNPTLPLEESSNKPPIARKIDEPSVFSQAPRVLVCHKVRTSSFGDWVIRGVHIPFYAPDLSEWIINRRLSQLPQDIDQAPLRESLKGKFDYRNVWLSTTSNAVFEREGYQFVVHHVSRDTLGYYHSVFDIFLKDAPLKLWLEGTMRVSDIRFEGIGIRDAYDLTYSYQVLRNELFPAGLLEDHFSGERVPKADQSEDMKNLVENVLNEDRLNHKVFWEIHFIPFINSVSKE